MKIWDLIKKMKGHAGAAIRADDRRQNIMPALYSDYSCDYPSQYMIEPANICNLKCPFCVQGKEQQEYFPAKGS